MNITCLKGFNNYFNRIVKKYSTLEDYKSHSTSYVDFLDINFNPNDGVVTELIFGSTTQLENNKPLAWDTEGTPDYLVCHETVNNAENIISRWFVLESERTRNGQYRIALKRDVIADHTNSILNAPCFIEKGILNDDTNPLIFNKESMTFNQIKSDEILLKDETESAWIVGYLNNKENADNIYSTSVTLSNSGGASGTYTHGTGESISGIVEAYVSSGPDTAHHPEYVSATVNSSGNIDWVISWPAFAGLSVYLYIAYDRTIDIEVDATQEGSAEGAIEASDLPWTFDPTANAVSVVDSAQFSAGFVYQTGSSSYRYYNCRPVLKNRGAYFGAPSTSDVESPWANPDVSVDITNNFNILAIKYPSSYDYRSGVYFGFKFENTLIQQILNAGSIGATLTANPLEYNGAIIHYSNKYYRIYIGAASGTSSQLVTINRGTTLYNSVTAKYESLVNSANSSAGISGPIWQFHDATGEVYKTVTIETKDYPLTVEEINPEISLFVHFPGASTRAHADDAVYDMFCIPYNAVKFYNGTLTSSPYYSIKTALALSKAFGSQLYDLQLLPYCPAREWISGTNTISERSGAENVNYFYIEKSNGDKVSFGLFCTSSSGTFDITCPLEIPTVSTNSAINAKVSNECDLYRLVSPNYAGQFEFSLAKNRGVTSFNVDYTYRPYNPYIHINPAFSGLYGTDWDDARGLICGGDFSLPIINDAWTNYQLQNKNYQEIFDRQIQNIDVNNAIAKEQQQWQKITGALTGGIGAGVAGGLAGAKAGGGYGAIAGAALGITAGTALSIIGGEKDEEWLLRQQAEARDYTTDMYNYQLGNIQALPYSLAKSGTLTNNNKIFPMIEYYTCTLTEKEALLNVLRYDGMTIMAVGNIGDYIPSSDLSIIKGRIIRLDELADDFHIADAIYQEIQKGVYLTPGLE